MAHRKRHSHANPTAVPVTVASIAVTVAASIATWLMAKESRTNIDSTTSTDRQRAKTHAKWGWVESAASSYGYDQRPATAAEFLASARSRIAGDDGGVFRLTENGICLPPSATDLPASHPLSKEYLKPTHYSSSYVTVVGGPAVAAFPGGKGIWPYSPEYDKLLAAQTAPAPVEPAPVDYPYANRNDSTSAYGSLADALVYAAEPIDRSAEPNTHVDSTDDDRDPWGDGDWGDDIGQDNREDQDDRENQDAHR